MEDTHFHFPTYLFENTQLKSNLGVHKLEKNESIIPEFLHDDKITMVISGLIMMYWKDEEGNKIIIDFKRPGEILRAAANIDNSYTGDMYGVALKATEIRVLDRFFFCSCATNNDNISEFYYGLLKKDISSTYRQLKLHKETDLKKRYEIFLNEYKDIYNDVTDRMVANYLGVHHTSLSRLKAKIIAG